MKKPLLGEALPVQTSNATVVSYMASARVQLGSSVHGRGCSPCREEDGARDQGGRVNTES